MVGIGSSGGLYKGCHGFWSHLMVLPSRYLLLPYGELKAQEPETIIQDMAATAPLEYEVSLCWGESHVSCKIFNQVNI